MIAAVEQSRRDANKGNFASEADPRIPLNKKKCIF